MRGQLAQRVAGVTYRLLKWGHDHVPIGVRSLVGVLFMVGGVFGFFPLFGFWMFPLGLAFVALDIPWTRHRIQAWMEVLRAKARRSRRYHDGEATETTEEGGGSR